MPSLLWCGKRATAAILHCELGDARTASGQEIEVGGGGALNEEARGRPVAGETARRSVICDGKPSCLVYMTFNNMSVQLCCGEAAASPMSC